MKKQFILGIVSLALAAPACVDDAAECRDLHGTVVLQYDADRFTSAENERIAVVQSAWNQFAGREVLRFELGRRDYCALTKSGEYGTGKFKLAWANRDEGTIKIGEVYDCGSASGLVGADCFEGMLVHEAGHMLGLEHVSDEHSVMYSKANTRAFSSSDREECRRVGVCRMN